MQDDQQETTPPEDGDQEQPQTRENLRGEDRQNKVWRYILIICLIVLVIYGCGVGFFHHHFLTGTEVMGTSVGNLTTQQASQKIEGDITDQKVEVLENEEPVGEVPVTDFQTPSETDQVLTSVQSKQNEWLWPLSIFSSKKSSLEAQEKAIPQEVADEETETFLSQLGINNAKRTPSENARLVRNQEGSYEVSPEVYGDQVSSERLGQAMTEAINSGNYTIDLADCYALPTITEDDPSLEEAINQYEDALGQKLTINIGDKQKIDIKKEDLSKWLAFDDNNQMYVDQDAVDDFLQDWNQKNSGLLTAHDFNSTLSGTVKVQPGTYGWYIDREATTPQVVSAVQSGEDQEVDATIAGDGLDKDNFFGNTYVEVDIPQQRMFVYQDGNQILSTDVVTGSDKSPTVPGAYQVWNKETNTSLKGVSSVTGEPYESPVSYWLPFDDTGQGIHDASWQPTFGGSWYHQNGSLGCVNTPPSTMPTVFSEVEVGTPVIVFN